MTQDELYRELMVAADELWSQRFEALPEDERGAIACAKAFVLIPFRFTTGVASVTGLVPGEFARIVGTATLSDRFEELLAEFHHSGFRMMPEPSVKAVLEEVKTWKRMLSTILRLDVERDVRLVRWEDWNFQRATSLFRLSGGPEMTCERESIQLN